MDLTRFVHPNAVSLALAAGAVVAGAPLFSEGLRAFRLRRYLRRVCEHALADAPPGFVHVRGTVALESPLFSPLSALPCAGYRLEVSAVGAAIGRTLDV